MNDPVALSLALHSFHLNPAYVQQAQQALTERQHRLHWLFQHKRLPQSSSSSSLSLSSSAATTSTTDSSEYENEDEHVIITGWSDSDIEWLLNDLSCMDGNNFSSGIGCGEREGRVYSSLVSHRHYHLSHGQGRSGSLLAQQPKAIGSSLLVALTTALLLDALHCAGYTNIQSCVIMPTATGMTITHTLNTIKVLRRQESSRVSTTPSPRLPQYVLMPRIDQHSCRKSIIAADCVPVLLELSLVGDELMTDVDALQNEIRHLGSSSIVAVISVTSCFAPRSPDRIVDIARICKEEGIPHIINNAYGIQSKELAKLINRACVCGRVDAVISSLDKNFLVPVGGALIASPHQYSDSTSSSSSSSSSSSLSSSPLSLSSIASVYPGRASVSSVVDVFITLLSLGNTGWKSLLSKREKLFHTMKEQLSRVAEQCGERLLHTPNNPVSMAMTINQLDHEAESSASTTTTSSSSTTTSTSISSTTDHVASSSLSSLSLPSVIGSMLFKRFVSGARAQSVSSSFGAHSQSYPFSYLSVACAIGMKGTEVVTVCRKIKSCFKQAHKQQAKQSKHKQHETGMPLEEVKIEREQGNNNVPQLDAG